MNTNLFFDFGNPFIFHLLFAIRVHSWLNFFGSYISLASHELFVIQYRDQFFGRRFERGAVLRFERDFDAVVWRGETRIGADGDLRVGVGHGAQPSGYVELFLERVKRPSEEWRDAEPLADRHELFAEEFGHAGQDEDVSDAQHRPPRLFGN